MIMKLFQGGRPTPTFCQFVVDAEEDVKRIKILPNGGNMGSEVYVIANRKTYILDSKGSWHPKATDGEPIECDCVEESTIWEDLPEPTK